MRMIDSHHVDTWGAAGPGQPGHGIAPQEGERGGRTRRDARRVVGLLVALLHRRDRTGGSASGGATRPTGQARHRLAGARCVLLLGLLGGVGALAPRLAAPVRADGGIQTSTVTSPGEYPFTVPNGITTLHAILIGGHGADSNGTFYGGGSGGFGAVITANIPVVSGSTVYVEVGGNGSAGAFFTDGAGGYNGGATTSAAGGGGGASDIRTCAAAATTCASASDTLHSRLVVAGGGGGGFYGFSGAGGGGNADQPGATGDSSYASQGAGPGSGGGAGGASGSYAGGTPGQDGSFGVGGAGGSFENPGGGGGGGYYGGGGGGSANGAGGGGGGGGASFVLPTASGVTLGADSTGTPEVVLRYGQATLTITANTKTMTYGGVAPIFDATDTGLQAGDTSSVVSGLTCGATDSHGQPVSSSTPAGTYAITCRGASAPNYSIIYGAGTLTVTPAPLTITANAKSMTYGGPVPSFDAAYSGVINGDTSGVVSGLTCGATDGNGHAVSSSTPAGTYQITCTGGSAANYSITYQASTLTVTPAPLTITATKG